MYRSTSLCASLSDTFSHHHLAVMSTAHKPSLKTILSEATDVITTSPSHFTILSLVFLLPTSISILLLQISTSSYKHDRHSTPHQLQNPYSYLLVFALYVLFSLCAKASITYSAFHGYYNRPVETITSLKAALHSFFPLLATSIVAQTVYCLIFLSFAGLTYALYSFLILLGFDVGYDSSNLIILVLLMTSLLLIVLVYFGLNWYLSSVVVVIESKWGFAPLKKSSYLSKGMTGMLFSMMILFGAISTVLSLASTHVIANAGGRFTNWEFISQMTILAVLVTICSLYSMATSVVLFVHCKDLKGEFKDDGSDYVRLSGVEHVINGVDAV